MKPHSTKWILFFLLLGGLVETVVAKPETLLEGAGSRLALDEGRLQIYREKTLVFEVQGFDFNFHAAKTFAIGERSADKLTLHSVYPSEADYFEKGGDLSVDIAVERVPGGYHFTAKPQWAHNVTVRLSDLDDHFFGVLEMLYPNNQRKPDLRGAVVDVEAVGSEQQYHENYASAWSAFYMTARGAASFFDTFAKGRYKLGVGGQTELYHQTGALDWYVFVGRNGDELLTSYYKVIGAPKVPPLWATGPIGWRDENHGGSDEILADVEHMTQMRIPFTAWFVDRPYSEGQREWSKMNFNAKFAKPEEWIGKLDKDYGLKFMTWIAPNTFGDTNFPGLLPGDFAYIDLTDPSGTAELEKRLKAQYAAGVRGHKNDRGEELFPETEKWKDGTLLPERHNKYVFLYAKVTHEILTRAWGADHVNFARGAVHRTQPYLSALWGGDSRASWDGLAANLANSIRCGFMGFPVWGTDVGGYHGGHIDEELYARWLAWGAWNGLFEIKLDNIAGKDQDRPPWTYGENLQKAFREACDLRMQLLPYIYSLGVTAGHTGVLMKPLAYVWPEDKKTYDIWDEYLFGPAFLVAPITAPGGQRQIYLPKGKWHDFYEPQKVFEGEKTLTIAAPFNRIPVFVRENSIYVTGNLAVGNGFRWDGSAKASYVVQVSPGDDGDETSFELIDAAGNGETKLITASVRRGKIRVKIPALSAPVELRVHEEPPAHVRVNNRPFDSKFDPTVASYRIPLPANVAHEIEIDPFTPGATR
ncbi:MAG: glycoside hydrolase family 31 protein [Nibricoccus sp.]